MGKTQIICVTGATGFLGKRLSARLLKSGARVVGLALGKEPPEFRSFKNFAFESCNIADRNGVQNFFKAHKPDIIFHTAVYIPKDAPDISRLFRTNIRGTFNILEAAAKYGTRLMVYSSSMSIYGPQINSRPIKESGECNPDSDYGFSKLSGERMVEHYAKNHALKAVVLRYGGIYGPGREDGAVAAFAKAALAGGELTVTENRTWDIIHVDDVAAANDIIRQKTIKGNFNVFNISSGVAISVSEVAQKLVALGDGKAKIIRRMSGRKFFSPCLDIGKAKNILGFNPRSPTEGLKDYVQEIQNKSS